MRQKVWHYGLLIVLVCNMFLLIKHQVWSHLLTNSPGEIFAKGKSDLNPSQSDHHKTTSEESPCVIYPKKKCAWPIGRTHQRSSKSLICTVIVIWTQLLISTKVHAFLSDPFSISLTSLSSGCILIFPMKSCGPFRFCRTHPHQRPRLCPFNPDLVTQQIQVHQSRVLFETLGQGLTGDICQGIGIRRMRHRGETEWNRNVNCNTMGWKVCNMVSFTIKFAHICSETALERYYPDFQSNPQPIWPPRKKQWRITIQKWARPCEAIGKKHRSSLMSLGSEW